MMCLKQKKMFEAQVEQLGNVVLSMMDQKTQLESMSHAQEVVQAQRIATDQQKVRSQDPSRVLCPEIHVPYSLSLSAPCFRFPPLPAPSPAPCPPAPAPEGLAARSRGKAAASLAARRVPTAAKITRVAEVHEDHERGRSGQHPGRAGGHQGQFRGGHAGHGLRWGARDFARHEFDYADRTRTVIRDVSYLYR